jgi:WD40 repeat protein
VPHGTLLHTPTDPYGAQAPAVFSPNGNMLGVPLNGAFDLWNVLTRHLVAILGNSRKALYSVGLVASSPGRILVSNAGSALYLWDLATDKVINTHTTVYDLNEPTALNPDGTILAGYDGPAQLQLWDLANGRDLGALPARSTANGTTLAFSPDGSELAIGGNDGTVQMWDVATRKQVGAAISTNDDGVRGLAFSPDGRTLAVGGADGTVRLWDVARDPQVIRAHNDTDPIAVVAFSPDGKTLMTASARGTTRVWDIAAAQQTSATASWSDPSPVEAGPTSRWPSARTARR